MWGHPTRPRHRSGNRVFTRRIETQVSGLNQRGFSQYKFSSTAYHTTIPAVQQMSAPQHTPTPAVQQTTQAPQTRAYNNPGCLADNFSFTAHQLSRGYPPLHSIQQHQSPRQLQLHEIQQHQLSSNCSSTAYSYNHCPDDFSSTAYSYTSCPEDDFSSAAYSNSSCPADEFSFPAYTVVTSHIGGPENVWNLTAYDCANCPAEKS